jgi:pyruvate/2-oxoglutarate dehydrogenase complex dihydrolipoamide acyltransferase (E2) component
MRTAVEMPHYAADAESGRIVEWMKQPGDAVERGEALVEIETDKANLDVEAMVAGVLDEIVHGEGDEVPVGEVIGWIREA